MKKSEIWWSNQPKPIGRRPVLLLSRDESYKVRDVVIVAQITTNSRKLPIEVVLDKEDGLPKKCVVNLDNISTIRKSLLSQRICSLKLNKVSQVNRALKFALDLE